MNGEVKTLLYTSPKEEVAEEPVGAKKDDGSPLERGQLSFRLEELAYLRSGDKGDSANIGVLLKHGRAVMAVVFLSLQAWWHDTLATSPT